jgi:hypothetical protein
MHSANESRNEAPTNSKLKFDDNSPPPPPKITPSKSNIVVVVVVANYGAINSLG